MRISAGVRGVLFVSAIALQSAAQPPRPVPQQHNVIIFVADGLRRDSVNQTDTPNLWRVRNAWVDFPNSHSVYPTFTTANASVIATGHGLGDTGDYSNTLYPGVWLTRPEMPAASGSVVPFLEADDVLANMNHLFGGNYLGQVTLLTAALQKGFNVAAIGKVGPTAIQLINTVGWDEVGKLSAGGAIVVDDSTGTDTSFPLPSELVEAMAKAGLPLQAPSRSNGFDSNSQWNNGFSGDATTPGTL